MERLPLLTGSVKRNYGTNQNSEPEMSQNSTRETGSNGKYSVHHGIAFLTTFVTYSFFHAARKTLSNSKDSISLFWTENEFNKTNPSP